MRTPRCSRGWRRFWRARVPRKVLTAARFRSPIETRWRLSCTSMYSAIVADGAESMGRSGALKTCVSSTTQMLRHCRTAMPAAGYPLANRLGHSGPAVTLRVYAHVLRESAAGVADAFANAIERLLLANLLVSSLAKTTKPNGQRGPRICGGQGRGRTADLPSFSRTLVPTELPGPAAC